jgi:exodeoxyribonuclease-5
MHQKKASLGTAATVHEARIPDRLDDAISNPSNTPPVRRQGAPRIAWSPQQVAAQAKIERWRSNGVEPFYLAGYAGTGKSTLASEIARRCGGSVVYGAYTGKAAAVMRAKGCHGATTIDSLIYHPAVSISCAADPPCEHPPCRDRCRYARERFIGRTLNPESAVAGADLVIIDEVSMVDARMGRDLLSFGVPVLVLGDNAQLPPIGGAGFFTRREPDFQLTEVHRQAFGSPIIKLATRVREGLMLQHGTYGDSAVVEDVGDADMLDVDQVIVGTHRLRHRINKKMRRALGFTGTTPERGEKVLCLKNNRAKNLRNGTLWTVIEAASLSDGFITMTVKGDEGETVEVIAPEEGFSSYDSNGADLPEQPFAFGYCITCHKAQGSQWDSVLVFDESDVFREHCQRWLYTAITRAAKRVVVVS